MDDRLMYRREFFLGGFRESGLGRELGPEGLQNFLEPRSIGLFASLR
jgi:acyl-CoA reductase-like NAD-dependent aldehyde dehydrogenase